MTDERSHNAVPSVAAGQSPEQRKKPGRLKIFLGIGPGVGKTAAMLHAAWADKLAGRDVVVVIAHARGDKSVENLAARLPRIGANARRAESPSGRELDWEQIAARRPEVVVVDELAHANGMDARHPNRYQDVLELLEAGIDVYATLNVYEIASQTGLLWQAAGAANGRTIPDTILDKAAIVLVDLPPADLLAKLRKGQIRFRQDSGLKKSLFFEEDNLMALREAAARMFAERVAAEAQERRRAANAHGPAKTSHRVLLAIQSGHDSERIILWTRRLAGSLNARWIVLYVETSPGLPLEEESRLTRNLELARELGAEVITTASEDFVDTVLRMAASRNVTQIVTAKTEPPPWWQPFPGDPAVARLIRGSGGMSVHVVPAQEGTRPRAARPSLAGLGRWQYAAALGAAGVVAATGFLLTPIAGSQATALLSLLGIVVLALFLERGPALLAAALIAAVWDYFFIPPQFSLRVAHFADQVLLGMYFVVALVLGQLTSRVRAQEAGERQRETRATALYLLTRELAEATTTAQLVAKVALEMKRCFGAEAAVLLPEGAGGLVAQPGGSLALGDKERAVAAWVREHRQPAGKFTANLAAVDTMFVPLESGHTLVGVMGLRLGQSAPLTLHQRNLLDALAHQIALALDRQRLNELSKKARLVAESERLAKTLLDSMSHEIRTPVAVIKTAAGDLAELGSADAPGAELIAEIQEAAERLNRLVGKVLDITRLESGHIKPSLNECDISDIVNTAVAETGKDLARHPLTVEIEPGLPIIRTDFVLLQQSLMNLLSNAGFHTPAGTPVTLRAWTRGGAFCLSVADCGAGLDPESIPRVFEKFYRAPAAPTGGSGLGLSLVKGFVEALGGNVKAANRPGGGAEFTIELPLKSASPEPSVSI